MEGVPQRRGGAEVLGDPKLDLRCVSECVCVCARYRTKLGYDKKGGLMLALAPCFCTLQIFFSALRGSGKAFRIRLRRVLPPYFFRRHEGRERTVTGIQLYPKLAGRPGYAIIRLPRRLHHL